MKKQRPLPLYVSCALLLLLATVFGLQSWQLGLWSDGMPGPGLLPGSGAVLLAVLVLALATRGSLVPDEAFAFSARPFLALVLLMLYAAALPHAGFVPATFVAVTLWTRLFHGQGWRRAVLLAAALIAACVGVFGMALEVPMPLFPERA